MILLSQMAFSPWNIIRYMSKYWQAGGGGGCLHHPGEAHFLILSTKVVASKKNTTAFQKRFGLFSPSSLCDNLYPNIYLFERLQKSSRVVLRNKCQSVT